MWSLVTNMSSSVCHKCEHFWWLLGKSFEREAISKPIKINIKTFKFQVYKIHVASRGLGLTTCQSCLQKALTRQNYSGLAEGKLLPSCLLFLSSELFLTFIGMSPYSFRGLNGCSELPKRWTRDSYGVMKPLWKPSPVRPSTGCNGNP